MWYLIKAFYVVIFLSGLALMYAALFLYEDEQRKIQNVLEDLWLSINDNRNKLLSRHTVFMRVVVRFANSIFDRLFGKKLFSLRSFTSSALYSHASLWLASYIFFVKASEPRVYQYLVLSFVYIILGAIPVLTKKRRWLIFWYVMAGLFNIIIWVIFYLILRYGSMPERASLVINIMCAVGLGILSDVMFIALSRKLLRWSAGLESFSKIVTIILLNCLVAFVLVIGPYFFAKWTLTPLPRGAIISPIRSLAFSLFLMALSNSITTLTALFFLVLALIMLIHRLFWPLIERPVYTLQRFGIARRSKLLGTTGIILIGISLGIQPAWLKDIVDKLIS